MNAVKVIRIVRTLRFVRILKLLGKFKRRYRMTPVFVSRTVSLSVTVVVLALIGFAFLDGGRVLKPKSSEVRMVISNSLKGGKSVPLSELISGTESVIFIKKDNKTVYQSMPESSFRARFIGDDYSVQTLNPYQVTFNNKDVKRTEAFINMLALSIILGILLFMATFYRFFFNRHVSVLLSTMTRGFKTADYSTAVRTDERRADFEIYQLADQYNGKWLPLKRKILELKKNR
jgi:hypothetical protein